MHVCVAIVSFFLCTYDQLDYSIILYKERIRHIVISKQKWDSFLGQDFQERACSFPLVIIRFSSISVQSEPSQL